MTTRAIAALLLTSTLMLLSGCGETAEVPPADEGRVQLEAIIAAAVESGASARQVEILKDALDGEGISFEELVELNAMTVDCLNEGGLDAFVVETAEIAPGLLMPQFGVRFPDGDQPPEAFTHCFYRHLAYAQQFYELQPTSVQQQNDAFELARPEVIECLERRGVVVDKDLTNSELYAAVNQESLENGQQPGYSPCYRGTLSTSP